MLRVLSHSALRWNFPYSTILGFWIWVCWVNEPRANKLPLRYSSAHSELIKRNTVLYSLSNALWKSCVHLVDQRLQKQVACLEAADYPKHVIVRSLRARIKKGSLHHAWVTSASCENDKRKGHNSKKAGQQSGIKVVFTVCQRQISFWGCDWTGHLLCAIFACCHYEQPSTPSFI